MFIIPPFKPLLLPSPGGTTPEVRLLRGLQKSENTALGQKMPFPDGH
jgi:hypothetical protein